jgi:hypothetical protein
MNRVNNSNRVKSDWYYFSGLHVFVYGENPEEAIYSFMSQNHPGDLYRWLPIPPYNKDEEYVILLMDKANFGCFRVEYKVSRAYGKPGVPRAKIQAVSTLKQATFTTVPIMALTQIHCDSVTSMEDWVFDHALQRLMYGPNDRRGPRAVSESLGFYS